MRNHGRSGEMQRALETVRALLDGPPDVIIASPVAAKGSSI